VANGPDPKARGAAGGRLLADRYRLNHLLAVGGMSEVWAGTDELLQRPVAVKVLRPGLASHAALVARFRQEAVAAARVRHPSVVGVLDTVTGDGDDAVVMELVSGHSLRHVLDDHGRLGAARTAAIGAAVAEGLDAIHRAGLVHRDIKPANILLADDGRVLVADLGLAKAVQLDDDGGRRTVVGTPKYLAPEQVRGLPVDGRADLYALGVVLFECLTGQAPFTGADDTAVAAARLRRNAPPVRELAPDVPRPLAEIVARLLSRDPGRRPPTARAVGQELGRLAENLPPEPALLLEPVAGATIDPDPTPAVPVTQGSGQKWFLVALAATGVTAMLALAGALVSGTGERPAMVPAALGAAQVASAQPAPTTAAAATTSQAPAASVPLEVLGSAEFDPAPEGDGRENPDLLGLINDGNDGSVWESVCYYEANFAPKAGIGLVLELSTSAAGRGMVVTTPMAGWSGAVRVASAPATTLAGWGAPVATVEDAPAGPVTFDLPPSSTGRYVLLLVTKGPKGGPSCRKAPYQARIGEIRFTG